MKNEKLWRGTEIPRLSFVFSVLGHTEKQVLPLFREKSIPLRDRAFLMVMKRGIVVGILAVVGFVSSCGRMDDIVDEAQTKIRSYLHGQKIYDPTNYPDPMPTDEKGRYDIVGGAFRYIVTQDSDGRDGWAEVKNGDEIALWFDARIFSGSSFDRFPLFYSNNATTIEIYRGSNDQFDPVEWPTTPFIAKLGDGQLMPAVENALVGCRVGDKVQLFIPPDIGYGNRQNYSVPANATLAFEITIQSIE
jgi:hypothetical protein